jgi:hypothetical protein
MSQTLPPISEEPADWFVIDRPYPTLFAEEVQKVTEQLLHCQGRFFVRCQLRLPLQAEVPAIEILTWAEISRADSADIVDADESPDDRGQLLLTSRLAADIPGYEGVIGAETTITYTAGGPAQIDDISDQRLPRGESSIERLDEIEKAIRGTALRDQEHEIIAEQGEALFGRATYSLEIPPPLGTGLSDAGRILIAPPVDTGQAAQMMTIGSSDILDDDGLPEPEIITELINPSDEAVRCFADFNFVSRIHPGILTPGSMIGEVDGIPGSSGMKAWILWHPEDSEEPVTLANGIRLLQAFPIYEAEMNFALDQGPEALIERIMIADYSDLKREVLV